MPYYRIGKKHLKRMRKKKRRAVKVVRGFEKPEVVKLSQRQKMQIRIKERLLNDKNQMLVLKGMVRNLKEIKAYLQMEQVLRQVCVFDPYFKAYEPNLVKRRKRLRNILSLDISLKDFDWVMEMHAIIKRIKRHNNKIAVKQIINNKQQ
jgi:hypothetical protein